VCAKLFGYDSIAEFIADQPRNLWSDRRDRELMLEKFRETSMIRNLEARLAAQGRHTVLGVGQSDEA